MHTAIPQGLHSKALYGSSLEWLRFRVACGLREQPAGGFGP